MTVTQISVFVQNRPGHLHRVLEAIADQGINVRGFSASDTGEYGIVRFIVDDPDRTLQFLRESGYAVSASPVICIGLDDRPGALREALRILAERSINVVYCYSMAATGIVVAVRDEASALAALADSPLRLLDQDAIARLEPTAFDGAARA